MQLLRKALLEQTAIYMAILFLARLSLSSFSLYICKYKLFHFLSNHFGRCHIFTFPGSGLCSFQKISSRKRNCWSALTTRKLVAKKNQWHIKQRTAALLIKIYRNLENIISEKCLFLLGIAAWLPQERSPQQQEQRARLEILISNKHTDTHKGKRQTQTQYQTHWDKDKDKLKHKQRTTLN